MKVSRKGKCSGAKNGRSKLSIDDVNLIKNEYIFNKSLKYFLDKYNISTGRYG